MSDYIEARMYDEDGEVAEAYFWYTDDVRYALHESLERANGENVGYEYMQLFASDDTDDGILVAEFQDGEENIYCEYV